MRPARQGDGTGLSASGFSEVRKGDGTVLWSAAPDIPDSVETQYRFEDDSDTTTALDGVGSNNATISGPTYTSNAAKGSHAIEDDGVDRSGNNVESNATVDLVASGDSQALSVGCFARPEGATGFYYPVSYGINGGDTLSVVAGADAGNWKARLFIGGTVVHADSGVSVESSTYTAVFAVADQSEVGIIVDGTLEATTTHSLDLTNIGAGSYKAIQGHSSVGNIFDGGVDDATYASDRLSAVEVQQLIDR